MASLSSENNNNPNHNQYTAISLFSGLGGDTLGLQNSNCNVVAYNEINKTFCKSHEANFPNSVLIQENNNSDISKISDSIFEEYKDNVDIIFAGFPCQGFSNAGKKKDDDPRNTLFREFLRVTRLVNPKMIIGENVKGLLSKKTTNKENYIDVIISEFEKLDYIVDKRVMKCNKYGVPQKRERLIIIGIKRENPYNWNIIFPEEEKAEPNLKNIIKYEYDENMLHSLRVDDNLFDELEIPEECIIQNMNDDTTPPENSKPHPYLLSKYNAKSEKLTYQDKSYNHLFSFGKRISPIHCEIIDIRRPSKTIICTYDHQPRLFVPIKNNSGCYLRVILPDELKQIQGFPENYILKGKKENEEDWKNKVVQIGNAVPPPLIERIVKNYTK